MKHDGVHEFTLQPFYGLFQSTGAYRRLLAECPVHPFLIAIDKERGRERGSGMPYRCVRVPLLFCKMQIESL